MFVRQTQLILIDESGNRTQPASPSSAAASGPTTPDEAGASRARSRLTRYKYLLNQRDIFTRLSFN